MPEIIKHSPESFTINDISRDLQHLADENKSASDNVESYKNFKELRTSVLSRLEQFVLNHPSKNNRKLMEFVWKRVCYPQISRLRPYLDLNSSKVLPYDSKKRNLYSKLFLNIIEEFMDFFRTTEEKLTQLRKHMGPRDKVDDIHYKEIEFMCNIWCGDLYRYLYNYEDTAVNFDNAVHCYMKAFLVDTNSDSSYNQLGVLYKINEDYFMSMFYLIKGCLNAEDPSSLISKNKDLTFVSLKKAYDALSVNDTSNSKKNGNSEIMLYKYGVVILVYEWLSPSKNIAALSKSLFDDTKRLQEKIISNMTAKISFMSVVDLNSEVCKNSLQRCLVYVCVLLIVSMEKLRKTDSSTFRVALEFFIDFIYLTTKYTVRVVDHIQGLNNQQEKTSFVRDSEDLNDEGFVASHYKNGYLCGRRAVRNLSSHNNLHMVDSESDNSTQDDYGDSGSADAPESIEYSSNEMKSTIKLDYALDHTCMDTLKMIAEWLTKSYHVIPVINEITNDDILKYVRKNVKHIRMVLSLVGFNEKVLNVEDIIEKQTFPEDFLVLDHHLFVRSKLQSYTDFNLLEKSHESSEKRVVFLGWLIDNDQIFQKGGFDKLMKSLEYVSKSEPIAGHRKNLTTDNRRSKPLNNKNKMDQSKSVYTAVSVVSVNTNRKKYHAVKANPVIAKQASTGEMLCITTPDVCIVEYGSFRNSLYLVRKILRNPLMTVVVTSSCINKLDYHKKNCQNARDGGKFIEGEISAGNGRLKLQDDDHFITIDQNDIPEGLGKFFIPLIECALYYRKHTPASIDISIVMCYHDFKRIQQSKILTNYLHEKLILQNINYINIEVLAKKK